MLTINKFTQKQVPGVEADDVIGTLSVRSVDAGYKVGFSSNNWQKKMEEYAGNLTRIFPKNSNKKFHCFLVLSQWIKTWTNLCIFCLNTDSRFYCHDNR